MKLMNKDAVKALWHIFTNPLILRMSNEQFLLIAKNIGWARALVDKGLGLIIYAKML